MSKNFRTQFEEIHFSMIFGIATEKDLQLVLKPKQENYKYKPYYHKVTSTLYTNKKYIIEKNPTITEDTKKK